ncbi:hypothetical protein CDV36_016638 [Fusarium kuroshium]|uniref:Uncharacterized protein n=3 Tax=Fusarium solani species complex TaxID=232080 RepID=A0A3M2QLA8_9HYPO|nr:hypothetical protein CDV36_016638 [Fusarium kuroshium]RSL39789.1 hypothetical protein CEP51_016770 [Fusarium floridanum]RSL77742.1 hypothetical protein CEP52_017692 [Fusarium oligoseptatum]
MPEQITAIRASASVPVPRRPAIPASRLSAPLRLTVDHNRPLTCYAISELLVKRYQRALTADKRIRLPKSLRSAAKSSGARWTSEEDETVRRMKQDGDS